jgi:protein phosphatase
MYGDTHVGLVRSKNEDRYLMKKINDDAVIFAVADGMGGEPAGDIAADVMISKLSDMQPDSWDILSLLCRCIEDANQAILDKVVENSSLMGMGTTVTCALVNKKMLHWAHVGDSRLYHFKGSRLLQVTKDQNMFQFLLEEGQLKSEDAYNHPSLKHLDQCVGCESCEPVTGTLEVNQGDLILFSTDGLHNEVKFENLRSVLLSDSDIKQKTNLLLNQALDAGGKDNITMIIAEI